MCSLSLLSITTHMNFVWSTFTRRVILLQNWLVCLPPPSLKSCCWFSLFFRNTKFYFDQQRSYQMLSCVRFSTSNTSYNEEYTHILKNLLTSVMKQNLTFNLGKNWHFHWSRKICQSRSQPEGKPAELLQNLSPLLDFYSTTLFYIILMSKPFIIFHTFWLLYLQCKPCTTCLCHAVITCMEAKRIWI